ERGFQLAQHAISVLLVDAGAPALEGPWLAAHGRLGPAPVGAGPEAAAHDVPVEDQVVGRPQHELEALVALAQRALDELERGHVTADALNLDHATLLVEDGGVRPLLPADAAVRLQHFVLVNHGRR